MSQINLLSSPYSVAHHVTRFIHGKLPPATNFVLKPKSEDQDLVDPCENYSPHGKSFTQLVNEICSLFKLLFREALAAQLTYAFNFYLLNRFSNALLIFVHQSCLVVDYT